MNIHACIIIAVSTSKMVNQTKKPEKKEGNPIKNVCRQGIPIDCERTRQMNRRKCPYCHGHIYHSHALIPCGHMFCNLCMLEFKEGQPCPLCQSVIIGKL